jgi:hypothetical protein
MACQDLIKRHHRYNIWKEPAEQVPLGNNLTVVGDGVVFLCTTMNGWVKLSLSLSSCFAIVDPGRQPVFEEF